MTPGNARGNVLETRDITVRFGGLVALHEVGLAVAPQSIVGLVGPNGAGKSTMFSVCSGLLRPTAGVVFLNGQDVTTSSPQSRSRLGLARTFQQPEVFAGLTVREHFVLAYRVRRARRRLWSDLFTAASLRRPDQAESRRVDELVELLALGEVANEFVDTLPLGATRLVEVGRALATEPSVMLLDEPLSGLDSKEAVGLADALCRTVDEQGISLLLVEHDVEMVLRMCSWIYVLDFGERIAAGTPDAIRSDPTVKAAYLGDDPAVDTGSG